MKTFSRGQQVIVLLIIFGMTLIYFNSINQPQSPHPTLPYNRLSEPATDHRPLTTANLSGAKLLTLNKKININTALASDLEAIRGIGPKTAEKIVEYRQNHGMFKRVEDIMKVNGIKEKGLEKIKISLTVE
ncbi:MAG: competence protein ComEA helix-hairpin-helix repeat protein [Deltaproteobacteria bacterium]|nr:competence protein ComEA helix-hairpin-helix repeat protein [Deltaproteobacteria bacterium]